MTVALLITVLILFLVAYFCIYLVDMVGLPAPINMIAKAIIVIIAIAAILQKTGLYSF